MKKQETNLLLHQVFLTVLTSIRFSSNIRNVKKVITSMNTTIYDWKSVLALRKILINDFYCDCVIRKWGKNDVQLIYMDSGNLVVLIKTDDFYEHVEGDVEEIYCKSNYHERKRKRQLQAGKNKKLIGLIKH